MKHKICKVCVENKELNNFAKKKGCVDNVLPTCKKCINIKNKIDRIKYIDTIKKNQFNIAIRDYIEKYNITFEEAVIRHEQAKEKRHSLKGLSAEEKSKRRLEYTKNWQNENKEEIKIKREKYFKSYRKKRSAYYSLASHKRRAKLKNLGSFTLEEWNKLEEFVNFKCLCCNKSIFDDDFPPTNNGNKKLTIDHVVPIKLNGSNTISNLQPLCWACHRKKRLNTTDYRAKEIISFIASMSFNNFFNNIPIF